MTTITPYAGLYIDHPIPPAEPRDPLAFFKDRWPQGKAQWDANRRLKIAYAARWETAPERTWSGSATGLLSRLPQVADTIDIGVHFPSSVRQVFRLVNARYRNGEIKSAWNNSRLTNAYMDRVLKGGSRARGGYDVALTIDSLAALPIPYFIYYDVTWDSLLTTTDTPERYIKHYGVSPARMKRMQARQHTIYERAAGIFTMTDWLARSIVEQSGIASSKVHVVHPGMNVPMHAGKVAINLPIRPAPRRKLLFIGRQDRPDDTFYRKGGDIVVQALAILRRDQDPQITLTIVGMDRWPLPGPVPDGVHMLGRLSPSEVSRIYDDHDLFVMPSRSEGFGIVFAEAQSRGLPCVARNAYGMPEVVVPGLSGALIRNDDPQQLATTIAAVLDDDALYAACRARAPQIADYFSWDRAAREIAWIIGKHMA